MRVTNQISVNRNLHGVMQRSESYMRAQEVITTGVRVNRSSDDPTDAARYMRLRTELSRNLQYQRNVDAARIRLGSADSSLQRVDDMLVETRSLSVQAAQVTSIEDGQALASEVEQMLESLVGEGNRKFIGRSMYSGSQIDQDPFIAVRDDDGKITSVILNVDNTSGEINGHISNNEAIELNLDGKQTFMGDTPGGSGDLFAMLIELRDGLLAEDIEVSEEIIGRVDDSMLRINAVRSEIGSRMQRVNRVEDRMFSREQFLVDHMSDAKDADLAEAAMELALEQSGYQAALASISKVMSTSLLNFMG
jgi:flagellar hook-associated protein 3 FlgL